MFPRPLLPCVLGLLVLLAAGCADEALVAPPDEAEAALADARHRDDHGDDRARVRPFQARFTTDLVQPAFPAPDRCGPFDPANGHFNLLNLQAGRGHARGLGPIRVTYEFCVDVQDLAEDGVLDRGIPYFNGRGVFTTQGGDQLFVDAEGVVKPSRRPGYDFEFREPFEVLGGTGRFEGATGQGRSQSVVDNELVLDDGEVVSRTFHRVHALLRLPRDD